MIHSPLICCFVLSACVTFLCTGFLHLPAKRLLGKPSDTEDLRHAETHDVQCLSLMTSEAELLCTKTLHGC